MQNVPINSRIRAVLNRAAARIAARVKSSPMASVRATPVHTAQPSALSSNSAPAAKVSPKPTPFASALARAQTLPIGTPARLAAVRAVLQAHAITPSLPARATIAAKPTAPTVTTAKRVPTLSREDQQIYAANRQFDAELKARSATACARHDPKAAPDAHARRVADFNRQAAALHVAEHGKHTS